MQLFSQEPKIDFLAWRKLAAIISGGLIVIALLCLFLRGLNFGIDFLGGTLIEIGYPDTVEVQTVRNALEAQGFDDALVQHFGTSRAILIRIPPHQEFSEAELSSQILSILNESYGQALDMRRVEFVGPQVGEELTEQGGLAMLIALGAILIYVALRFEYRFALGSVAALIHDVILTLGFFSLFGLDFDLTVLAATLAVIGYSLNDTIVVFDRVRENFRRMRRGSSEEIVNRSLNQTLSRTLMTSLTTMLVLLALFFLGGELIHGFSTALIIGVLVGTYSSIYVATSTILSLGISKKDLIPVRKEEGSDDGTMV